MNSTIGYLYQQIQQVLLIDVSGAFFNARWNPVYAKSLKLNLGVDNVILFQFLNQDQKPVNITGSTFTFRIISQDGETLLYSQDLVPLSNALGRARVTIPAADTRIMTAQPASYSIEVASGVLSQAVFTDDSSGARGDIDLVDSVFPRFCASTELTVPDQAPDSSVYYTSTVDTQGMPMTTFQFDTQSFTGAIQVQGSTSAVAATVDWYDVEFEDLTTRTIQNELIYSNSTQRQAITVSGYHPYLRLSLQVSSGQVVRTVYR